MCIYVYVYIYIYICIYLIIHICIYIYIPSYTYVLISNVCTVISIFLLIFSLASDQKTSQNFKTSEKAREDAAQSNQSLDFNGFLNSNCQQRLSPAQVLDGMTNGFWFQSPSLYPPHRSS